MPTGSPSPCMLQCGAYQEWPLPLKLLSSVVVPFLTVCINYLLSNIIFYTTRWCKYLTATQEVRRGRQPQQGEPIQSNSMPAVAASGAAGAMRTPPTPEHHPPLLLPAGQEWTYARWSSIAQLLNTAAIPLIANASIPSFAPTFRNVLFLRWAELFLRSEWG